MNFHVNATPNCSKRLRPIASIVIWIASSESALAARAAESQRRLLCSTRFKLRNNFATINFAADRRRFSSSWASQTRRRQIRQQTRRRRRAAAAAARKPPPLKRLRVDLPSNLVASCCESSRVKAMNSSRQSGQLVRTPILHIDEHLARRYSSLFQRKYANFQFSRQNSSDAYSTKLAPFSSAIMQIYAFAFLFCAKIRFRSRKRSRRSLTTRRLLMTSAARFRST